MKQRKDKKTPEKDQMQKDSRAVAAVTCEREIIKCFAASGILGYRKDDKQHEKKQENGLMRNGKHIKTDWNVLLKRIHSKID
jgi:hypothetical protein